MKTLPKIKDTKVIRETYEHLIWDDKKENTLKIVRFNNK